MTKRFKEIYPDIIRSNYCFTDNGEPIGDKEVCDLLNEQHETIERLKQNIDELLSVDIEEELLKENEELKQAIAETEKMVQSTYDELTKLRCIKKNLGRIKSQWDWIMEAIQYD